MLSERREAVDEIFARDSVEAILAALGAGAEEWQNKAAAAFQTRSPLALKLTLQAVRAARELQSLEEALNLEYRLTTRLFLHGEFVEGVRALLVDKDKAPKWRPASLEDVSDAMVAEFMGPLGVGEELGLTAP